MANFIKELRRRKVFTVAVAYAVIAWLVLQVAATVFPIFDAPPWVLKVVTALLVLGFPVALVLAWAYDLTRKGIVRTAEITPPADGEERLSDAEPAAKSVPSGSSFELPGGPSIAVLPFSNLSGDSEQDLFAEALTGDILSGLTRSSHLKVLNAGSGGGNADQADLTALAREWAASYLLQGSVRKSGDMLRVSARLLDASNGVQIWSQSYDRALNADSLFAVQDDIREQIVATLSDLHGVIYSTQSKNNVHRPTSSLNAYECLSVALAYDKRLDARHHLRARESLERAVELDPRFDEAWAHLSWVYTDEQIFGFNPLPDSMERALSAARKAVELNPDNYHNHWLLSRVHYFMGHRELFLAETRKALDLNASDGTTLGLIGLYTAFAGEWDQGMDMMAKARTLNPNHPDYYFMAFGLAAFVKGDYAGALEQLVKADLPEFVPQQAFLAATFVMLDRIGEAERVLETLRDAKPDLTLDGVAEMLSGFLLFQRQLVDRVIQCLGRAWRNNGGSSN